MKRTHGEVHQAKPEDLNGKLSLWEKRITLIHPFFGEEERFKVQWKNWLSWDLHDRSRVDIIIVDDCGTPGISDLITEDMKKELDFNLTVYRIIDNLKWSTPCALNLGIMAAQTEWTLVMDSDCLFDPENLKKLLNLKPKEDYHYKFVRNRVTNNEDWAKNTRYLPCTMLQRKDLFLDVGGFDEDFTGSFSGGYGFFDNHFDSKLRAAGYSLKYLSDIVATEYMDDFVGVRVARDKEHEKINKKLMYDKWNENIPDSRKMLRFNWIRTFHNRDSN